MQRRIERTNEFVKLRDQYCSANLKCKHGRVQGTYEEKYSMLHKSVIHQFNAYLTEVTTTGMNVEEFEEQFFYNLPMRLLTESSTASADLISQETVDLIWSAEATQFFSSWVEGSVARPTGLGIFGLHLEGSLKFSLKVWTGDSDESKQLRKKYLAPLVVCIRDATDLLLSYALMLTSRLPDKCLCMTVLLRTEMRKRVPRRCTDTSGHDKIRLFREAMSLEEQESILAAKLEESSSLSSELS